MPKLKIYAIGYGFPPQKIMELLGQPSHIRQADVYVVAHSKAGVVALLDAAHFPHMSPSSPELRIAGSPKAQNLLRTTSRPTIYVGPLLGNPTSGVIVAVDADGTRGIRVIDNSPKTVAIPTDMITRRWVCHSLNRVTYCTPDYPHGGDWPCGYRHEFSLTDAEFEKLSK